MVLIAEDLLLLATDNSTGKPVVGSTELDYGLAGAVLLELAMSGKVDVAGPGETVRKGRLVVLDPSPVGDAVLDAGLRRLVDRPGRKPAAMMGTMSKGLRKQLYDRLADQGLLRLEQRMVMGLFPTSRWPTVAPAHEEGLRRELHDALVVGVEPRPRTAALVSLLHAMKVVHKLVGGREDRKAVQARAKQISEGAWAAEAVRKAVDAVNSAMTAAVIGAAASAAAGGG